MDLKHHIGARVKTARRDKHLTQAQLAVAVDKATETISNIERGFAQSGLDTLEAIARVLGVPMTYFFEGAEESRKLSSARFEFEERLVALTREVRDAELPTVLAVVEAVVHRGSR